MDMRIVETKAGLSEVVAGYKGQGARVGFVPTMGALHAGHLSLVQRSVASCAKTVVSIFVNPTQFNDPTDLEKYPRTLKEDLALLQNSGCDVVFVPSVREIYPEPDTRIFNLSPLDAVMEGASRPGHFNGVAQVVSTLFEAVNPDEAFFGEKDFQQLAIIRLMVRQLNLSLTITGCPIVREPDGLAMSSRNRLLTPLLRQSAPSIFRALNEASALRGSLSVEALRAQVISQINQAPGLSVEYFEVMDADRLTPVASWESAPRIRGFVAVRAGSIRLIDNVPLGIL